MKNPKYIEKIEKSFRELMLLEKELNNSLSGKEVDKAQKLEIGGKVIKLQYITMDFYRTVQLYLEIEEGSLEDLSKEARTYYNIIIEMQKPKSEIQDEDLKKIKDFVDSLKAGNEAR